MATEDQVLEDIYSAIHEVNEMLEEEARLEKSLETRLADESGQLDSLGMVNLIVALEANLEVSFGEALNLSDALESEVTADVFRSVGSLRDYIAGRLAGHGSR